MVQPVASQCLDSRAGHRTEADVHGVRAQHGGDGQPQIGDAGVVSGDVGECLDETGMPGHDLEYQFGQVDLRQHLLHPAPQVDQRRWVGDRDQRGDVQLAVLVDRGGGVGVQPGGDLAVHLVQPGRIPGEKRPRLHRQIQRIHARVAGLLPHLTREQVCPGVTPPQ